MVKPENLDKHVSLLEDESEKEIRMFHGPDNVLLKRETYRAGKLDGQTITYFKDGRKSSLVSYEKGQLHGLSIYWHPANPRVIMETGCYEFGERVMEWTWYDEKGNKIDSINYGGHLITD